LIRIFGFLLCWCFVLVPACHGAIQIEFLAQFTLPTGLMYGNTEVGGLSGISYAPEEGIYYVISDDRSFRYPARFYKISIDIPDRQVPDLPVKIVGVTFLRDGEGEIFDGGSLDPEGIAVTEGGNFFVSSEGVTKRFIPPFVALYNSSGEQLNMMSVPESFLPSFDGRRGVRNNMGFEALTLSADGRFLTTASENALIQDGPRATLEQRSPCRLIVLDTRSGEVVHEYFYLTDRLPEQPVAPDTLPVNGLVELLDLEGEGSYLALERAYAEGKGFNIRLYQTTSGGTKRRESPVSLSKKLVLNLNTLGIPLDNLEGMSFGPTLVDGRRLLVVVSDNNFSRKQFTQILLFAVDAGAAHPTVLR